MEATECWLSDQERETVQFVADGLTSREIGGRLGLPFRVIERCITHARLKVDAPNAPSLVATAMRRGWIH